MEGNGHGLIHGTLLVSHLREVVEKKKKKEKEKEEENFMYNKLFRKEWLGFVQG